MPDITFWMVRDPPTISPDQTVLHAAKAMAQSESDYILVVEREKPIGIFTEEDVLRKIVVKKKDPDRAKVREVMTSPIETITDKADYNNVLLLMKKKHCRHLPVVDEKGKIIGMVTLQALTHNI